MAPRPRSAASSFRALEAAEKRLAVAVARRELDQRLLALGAAQPGRGRPAVRPDDWTRVLRVAGPPPDKAEALEIIRDRGEQIKRGYLIRLVEAVAAHPGSDWRELETVLDWMRHGSPKIARGTSYATMTAATQEWHRSLESRAKRDAAKAQLAKIPVDPARVLWRDEDSGIYAYRLVGVEADLTGIGAGHCMRRGSKEQTRIALRTPDGVAFMSITLTKTPEGWSFSQSKGDFNKIPPWTKAPTLAFVRAFVDEHGPFTRISNDLANIASDHADADKAARHFTFPTTREKRLELLRVLEPLVQPVKFAPVVSQVVPDTVQAWTLIKEHWPKLLPGYVRGLQAYALEGLARAGVPLPITSQVKIAASAESRGDLTKTTSPEDLVRVARYVRKHFVHVMKTSQDLAMRLGTRNQIRAWVKAQNKLAKPFESTRSRAFNTLLARVLQFPRDEVLAFVKRLPEHTAVAVLKNRPDVAARLPRTTFDGSVQAVIARQMPRAATRHAKALLRGLSEANAAGAVHLEGEEDDADPMSASVMLWHGAHLLPADVYIDLALALFEFDWIFTENFVEIPSEIQGYIAQKMADLPPDNAASVGFDLARRTSSGVDMALEYITALPRHRRREAVKNFEHWELCGELEEIDEETPPDVRWLASWVFGDELDPEAAAEARQHGLPVLGDQVDRRAG